MAGNYKGCRLLVEFTLFGSFTPKGLDPFVPGSPNPGSNRPSDHFWCLKMSCLCKNKVPKRIKSGQKSKKSKFFLFFCRFFQFLGLKSGWYGAIWPWTLKVLTIRIRWGAVCYCELTERASNRGLKGGKRVHFDRSISKSGKKSRKFPYWKWVKMDPFTPL